MGLTTPLVGWIGALAAIPFQEEDCRSEGPLSDVFRPWVRWEGGLARNLEFVRRLRRRSRRRRSQVPGSGGPKWALTGPEWVPNGPRTGPGAPLRGPKGLDVSFWKNKSQRPH